MFIFKFSTWKSHFIFSPGCVFLLHCQSFGTSYCCSVIQSRKYAHYDKSPSKNEENIQSSTYQGHGFKGLDFSPSV